MTPERTEIKFFNGYVVENFFAEKSDMNDLESIKRSYCASFVHEGCGGAPEAYVGILIGCTLCDATFPGYGPLGEAIKRTGEFRSMRIKG